jgi:serine/threonine-protein kinase RCK2
VSGIPSKVQKARDADVHQVEQGIRNTNLDASAKQAQMQKGYGQHSPAVAAAARQQVRNRKGAFELNLDGATLLGRRQKGPSALREATTVE